MTPCNLSESGMRRDSRRRRALGLAATTLATLSFSACNFDVSNPGPVRDQFLNDTTAFTAEVNGMGRALGNAMNYTVLQGAIPARELFPTGQTGQFGFEPNNQFGFLIPDEQNDPWYNAQQARWVSEHGLERFKEVLGDQRFGTNLTVAQGQLWAGYSERLLGENMCQAVFDGGALEPSVKYLERANTYFTSAIATATASAKPGSATVVSAATAGRASVRVALGDWTGAVADAQKVPTSFVYQMPFFDIGDEYQYNRIYWSSTLAALNRAHSVWNTPYEAYYTATGDPRVAYQVTDRMGNGAVEGVGPVKWYPQLKYKTKTSPINLSTGREMRLIEAEGALRNGDWTGAMATINQLRTSAGAPAAQAANSTEAWTVLKRERGVELWLEGRRLSDLRRWKATSTPGDLSPLETQGAPSYLKGQDLCFPLSRTEINTNPNVPRS
jgi:hypothetical protein